MRGLTLRVDIPVATGHVPCERSRCVRPIDSTNMGRVTPVVNLRSKVGRLVRGRERHGTQRDAARIDALARHLPRLGVGAEIGVHKGHFTPLLLDRLEPSRLHLIDPWYLIGREWNWGPPDRSTVNALCAIVKQHEQDLVAGRVVLHIGMDLEVLAAMPDGTFDWVYLDTTHEYAQTLDELDLLRRKVKADGWIAGDDWRSDPTHPHHGVCRAVREFLGGTTSDLVYASDDDQQWVIRRTPTAG